VIGLDLTIANADEVRDFYREVIGWTFDEYKFDDYSDYFMQAPDSGETVAGICHARGFNADQPPGWIPYVTVSDINASVARVVELGGKVLTPIKGDPGPGQFCVIEDPSGARIALSGL
jgi:predicted enzyme related to lactoylglutathione lyase